MLLRYYVYVYVTTVKRGMTPEHVTYQSLQTSSKLVDKYRRLEASAIQIVQLGSILRRLEGVRPVPGMPCCGFNNQTASNPVCTTCWTVIYKLLIRRYAATNSWIVP